MKKYPIGKQDFKSIREGNYIYVDKTPYIIKLLEGSSYYFLSRPRRFGKSLFISTLEYFFKGERHLFEGLAIDSYEKWNWKKHPVVHIDLNGAAYNNENSLFSRLNTLLQEYETYYGLHPLQGETTARFDKLLKQLWEKTGKKVVVLVDEYEKPVVDNITDERLSDIFRDQLRNFYGVLKSNDRILELVFLTGVTKFGKMSVFSALNNLDDISMDIDFGAICGITDSELRWNFSDGIKKLALQEEISEEEAIGELKKSYDGYHFTRDCPDIYNPFSIVSALSKCEIGYYWSATGTPTLLAELLISRNYNIEGLNGMKATKERLLDIRNQFDDPASLFYQTGYLTIKDYNRATKIYTLGFPNQEVEVAFFNFILPFYTKKRTGDPNSYIMDFAEGILEGDPEKALKALEAFTASVNYDMVPAPEVERHFQQMIYLFGRLILPYAVTVRTEDHTSDGRIDMLIETEKYAYIFEFKRDGSAKEALSQIKNKEYALRYRPDARKVFLIGMNFSTEKKRIEGFEIEEIEER